MSINTGHKPRNEHNGKYAHVCAWDQCGVTFRSNRITTRYCCFAHKLAATNQRYYHQHRKEIIPKVMLRKLRKGRTKPVEAPHQRNRKLISTEVDLDAMAPEQLMEYIRQNPQNVRSK